MEQLRRRRLPALQPEPRGQHAGRGLAVQLHPPAHGPLLEQHSRRTHRGRGRHLGLRHGAVQEVSRRSLRADGRILHRPRALRGDAPARRLPPRDSRGRRLPGLPQEGVEPRVAPSAPAQQRPRHVRAGQRARPHPGRRPSGRRHPGPLRRAEEIFPAHRRHLPQQRRAEHPVGAGAGLSGHLLGPGLQPHRGRQHRLRRPLLSRLDGQRRRERRRRHLRQRRIRLVPGRLGRTGAAHCRHRPRDGDRDGLGSGQIQLLVGQGAHRRGRRRWLRRQLQVHSRPLRQRQLAPLHIARPARTLRPRQPRRQHQHLLPQRPRSLPMARLSLVPRLRAGHLAGRPHACVHSPGSRHRRPAVALAGLVGQADCQRHRRRRHAMGGDRWPHLRLVGPRRDQRRR